MEDAQIVELYWQRSETAIAETDRKYGAFCYRISMNLLSSRADAEECVNDTWHEAWRQMPPQRPGRLKPWLGAIVRNLSVNLWHRNHAQKRDRGMEQMFSELEECLPSPQTVEREMEARELGQAISAWLYALPEEDRVLFVRRYWYGMPLKELAAGQKLAPGKLAQRMYRLRLDLKSALEREGIAI